MTFYLQLMRNKWLSPTGNILFQLENIKILKGWESPPPLLQAPRKKGKMSCDLDCELCGGWERFPWHGFRPRCSAPCPGRHVNIAPCLLSMLSSSHHLVSLSLSHLFNLIIWLWLLIIWLGINIYMEILMEQKDDWLKILAAANCEFI